MPLATPDELASWLGRNFGQQGDSEWQRAELFLTMAETVITDEAHQPLDQQQTTVALDGSGHRLLTLPRWPVVSVDRVTVDGVTLVEGDDYEWNDVGVLRRCGRKVWPDRYRGVEVVFTAGHNPVPTVIKEIALAAAARGYTNPEGKVSESYDNWQTRFTPTDGVGLTSAEQEIIARYAA